MDEVNGRLLHVLKSHWGAGKPTGVPRFSHYMKKAFPEIVNVNFCDVDDYTFKYGDVVITDNHLAVNFPEHVVKIIVHHGCARTHFERDPGWRNKNNEILCLLQEEMFLCDHVTFVAPSAWVAQQFKEVSRVRAAWSYAYYPLIIPHWVPTPVPMTVQTTPRPIILGDWRGYNKGEEVAKVLIDKLPHLEFVQLKYDAADAGARDRCYQQADAYLCLSLSEGAPYSVADAEARYLPIITTKVGNCFEFNNIHLIDDLENWDAVGAVILKALSEPVKPSFYDEWSFGKWRTAWQDAIDVAQAGATS